jgi:ribosomal protein S18 acetylase RimI-like enzyme
MHATIRRLAPGDERAASRVVALFKSTASPSSRPGQFLANRANYLIVAELATELAGFVVAYRLDRLDRDTAQLFVYEIGVLPEFQRRGIGTQLMQEIRRVVTAEGLMEAFVLTDQANVAAQRLYGGTGATIEEDQSMLFVYRSHAA